MQLQPKRDTPIILE